MLVSALCLRLCVSIALGLVKARSPSIYARELCGWRGRFRSSVPSLNHVPWQGQGPSTGLSSSNRPKHIFGGPACPGSVFVGFGWAGSSCDGGFVSSTISCFHYVGPLVTLACVSHTVGRSHMCHTCCFTLGVCHTVCMTMHGCGVGQAASVLYHQIPWTCSLFEPATRQSLESATMVLCLQAV